jgi:hypothetical protein
LESPTGAELDAEARVVVLHGTREIEARLVPLDAEALVPGETVYAQLRAGEPLPCLPGDRFVVRRASPAATVGGGVVVDPFAHVARRRNAAAAAAILDRIEAGDDEAWLLRAGAAGLFAAAWAGRTARDRGLSPAIVAVDGARKLGAKILVAGGGRCNVTHWRVADTDFAGSTPPAIRKVLARFTADDTVAFFKAAGVELKREDTGKLFPVTDSARTVLDALVGEAARSGAELLHPARVDAIIRDADGFLVTTSAGPLRAARVILCTGGKSLPKSGSDGGGHKLAASLGHSITSPIVPALVPLVLPTDHWITELSGLTLPTELVLSSATGKRLTA